MCPWICGFYILYEIVQYVVWNLYICIKLLYQRIGMPAFIRIRLGLHALLPLAQIIFYVPYTSISVNSLLLLNSVWQRCTLWNLWAYEIACFLSLLHLRKLNIKQSFAQERRMYLHFSSSLPPFSLSLSIYQSLSLSLPIYLSIYLTFSLSVSFSLSLSLSLSVSLHTKWIMTD